MTRSGSDSKRPRAFDFAPTRYDLHARVHKVCNLALGEATIPQVLSHCLREHPLRTPTCPIHYRARNGRRGNLIGEG